MIDLRSDTVTLPTQRMRDAMRDAEVGDSMRGDDPTMNQLEELAAKIVGKEAAIYVPSGTMGNLVCLLSHTNPGDEVIFEADAHAYYYEVGGFARVAGLAARVIRGQFGVMSPEQIEEAVRPAGAYFPIPRLLCIENTHNRGYGNAIRLDQMETMAITAHTMGLHVHLDGARIFNAAVALGVEVSKLTDCVDSIQFCLSKGLSAPVGSMVAGSHQFIKRAKRNRKLLGGDLRQSGHLAAAGILALTEMVDLLAEDHRKAACLAKGLMTCSKPKVLLPPIPTNMVFLDTTSLGMTAEYFLISMKEKGILCTSQGPFLARMVTHRLIADHEIEQTIQIVKTFSESYEKIEPEH